MLVSFLIRHFPIMDCSFSDIIIKAGPSQEEGGWGGSNIRQGSRDRPGTSVVGCRGHALLGGKVPEKI